MINYKIFELFLITSRLGFRFTLGHNLALIATVNDLGMEARLPVGVVLHGAYISVGLHQGVLSLDHVPVPLLLLVLVVPGVWIVYGILEGIARMSILGGRRVNIKWNHILFED